MRTLFFVSVAILFINLAQAQGVGIGTTTPSASAKLEISSTTQGFLPPRMTLAQRNLIPGPVAGLLIWCNDCTPTGVMQAFNGNAWANVGFSSALISFTTTAISSIGGLTATGGGNISSDGGFAVAFRGICWSTAPNPTISLSSITRDGSGMGSFTSSITGLTPGTIYYVRAYAINAAGIAYGNQITFTTLPPVIPTLTTVLSRVGGFTAISGGNITFDGYTPVTARGVCWSTSINPTTAGSKTIDGTGTGTFASNITGLNVNTTYYVRAYATNAVGTAYGNQISFTTQLAVGDNYLGGKIAYFLQAGDPGYNASVLHGLIITATDLSAGIQWYNGSYVATGATATAIGTGNANTNTIVAIQGAGSYAAKICYDLVLNGYTDWYLPSHDELVRVALNQAAIGGFFWASYWSSTESSYNIMAAMSLNILSNGLFGYEYKNNIRYVRAVRAF